MKLKVGTKVKFISEKQMYVVQASNGIFAVCTKPFNAQKTVLYTIINHLEKVRGTENLIFGMGAETREECEDMLKRLTQGDSEVSHRNRVPLDIEKVIVPKPQSLVEMRKNADKEGLTLAAYIDTYDLMPEDGSEAVKMIKAMECQIKE